MQSNKIRTLNTKPYRKFS